MKKISFVFAALCLSMLTLRPISSLAQVIAPEKSASAAAASDVQLIANNIEDNEDAMLLSQKAVDRAADSRIKDLAQVMVTDHTAMLYSLEQLATAGSGPAGQGGGKTQGMPQQVSEINDKLSKLRGSDFDTLWVSSLLGLQQLKYDELTQEKETVRNPQLKMAFTEAIPLLRKHLSQLRILQKSLEKMDIQKKKEEAKKEKEANKLKK